MIRFGAIVSVVAIAMGLLIVGAVAGDLTLVYASIGLAALALVMLIAGVAIWRDEIFGGRTGSGTGTTAEPEMVSASARGGAAAGGAGSRPAGEARDRPQGGTGGPGGPGRAGGGRRSRSERPGGTEATIGQAERMRGGATAASSGSAAAARTSHRSGGRPEREPGQRVRDERDREREHGQRERDQRDREQRDREQSQRDWSRAASTADSPTASARPPATPTGAAGNAAQAPTVGQPGQASAGSASRQPSAHGQTGTTRPLSGPPAPVRPYAAAAGGGMPPATHAIPRPAGSAERAGAAARPVPPGQSGPGRPDRGPSVPASPFFTRASEDSPDSAASRTPSPGRDERAQSASTVAHAAPSHPASTGQAPSHAGPSHAGPAHAGPSQAEAGPRQATAASRTPSAAANAAGTRSNQAAASSTSTPSALSRTPSAAADDRARVADHPPAAKGPSARSGGTVSVVPGIGRYHMADCILIRFLSADDLETMTLQAAEKIGCVPCRACRPDKAGAND